jgi:hypothetical protein
VAHGIHRVLRHVHHRTCEAAYGTSREERKPAQDYLIRCRARHRDEHSTLPRLLHLYRNALSLGYVISCARSLIPTDPSHAQVVTLWFDMKVWESIVAILFGIPLAVICIQCTGETDTTPTGAVGKVRFCDLWMRAGSHQLGSVCVVGTLIVGCKLHTHE